MLRTKRKVIISLHGIRTRGTWQKDLTPIITEQGWIHYPLDYGSFSLARFIPSVVRQKKIEWFREQYNEVHRRYPDVIPSIIAHSFGTWILCKALAKYRNLRFDKIILCGSIAARTFNWSESYARNQFTAVRNDIAKRDFWARHSKRFAWGTGDAGYAGFAQDADYLMQPEYTDYTHSSIFGDDHYLGEWIPFLGSIRPFGDGSIPADSEEPVSPYDAARWSAITYMKQYVCRVTEAFSRGEIFDDGGKAVPNSNRLRVLIPRKPGGASMNATRQYYKDHRLRAVLVGAVAPRTAHMDETGVLYDIPTTVHSLLSLDHRTDEELVDAVAEFGRTLQKRLNHPDSDANSIVEIVAMPER
jgi:hypothetical protein